MFVGTDFAGCLSTGNNTSGGATLRGKLQIRHWSVTQGTVTLSSAETELGGITEATDWLARQRAD